MRIYIARRIFGLIAILFVVVLLTFAFTTLVDEPATAVALVAILVMSIVIDLVWKQTRDRRVATTA